MGVFTHRKTAITIITPTIIFRGNGPDNTKEILELFMNVRLVHNTNKSCHFSAFF